MSVAQFHKDTQLSYYLDDPDEANLVVFFIHGLGCSKTWFLSQTQHKVVFDNSVSWLVPDLFGYGASAQTTNADELSMSEQGRRCFELACALLKNNRRVYVIAHSMGGPIGVHFIERFLAAAEKPFELVGCCYVSGRLAGAVVWRADMRARRTQAEGNVDEFDCFGSAKNAALPLEKFRLQYDERVSQLEAQQATQAEKDRAAKGDPNKDAGQCRATGAFTVHCSSVSLVEESRAITMLPRLRAVIDAGVKLVFVIGEKNRGAYESATALRLSGWLRRELHAEKSSAAAPGDVMFVPDCGHGMHYENNQTFWPVVKQLILWTK